MESSSEIDHSQASDCNLIQCLCKIFLARLVVLSWLYCYKILLLDFEAFAFDDELFLLVRASNSYFFQPPTLIYKPWPSDMRTSCCISCVDGSGKSNLWTNMVPLPLFEVMYGISFDSMDSHCIWQRVGASYLQDVLNMLITHRAPLHEQGPLLSRIKDNIESNQESTYFNIFCTESKISSINDFVPA